LHVAAWIKWKLGDYPAVEQYANELLRSARIAGDLWREAQALHILGMCSTEVGNYKRTISLCNRASQSLALCGITGGGATYGIRNSQAVVHNAKSEYVEARNIGVRILADVSMGEDPYIHAMASQSMAEVDLHMGAPQSDIQKNIDVAKSILNRVGQAGPALLCDVWQARLRLREGDILGASNLFQETFAASWGKDSTNAAYCLEVLGDIGLWGEIGLTPGWSTWATLFLVYSLKLKKNLQIHKALRCLGDVFLVQGDEVTAIGLWTTALDGFTLMDIHRGRADCMLRLGDISKGHGDMQRAAELWKTARPLFERSSQVNQVKQIDERLDSMDCCDESPRSAVGVSP
jgi:tetratricopeptide (TPR) repeat protein